MRTNRRRFITLGGLTAAGILAGCGSPNASSDESTPTDASGDGSGTTPTPTETDAGGSSDGSATGSVDYGGWFDNTSNFEGTTVDATGKSTVTVTVGAQGNDGNFAFDPPAVRVDPGTTVVWKWTGKGGAHNVVALDGSFKSGSPVSEAGHTFEHTFESQGVFKYYCNPHRGLGMKGAVVVGSAGGSGKDDGGGDGGDGQQYGWQGATFDSYWYSLYNMSTNIAMSGNGVVFPANQKQKQVFQKRIKGIAKAADVDRPPINNPNLNMAPFTAGDPHFTEKPVFEDDTGRPDASTLAWDKSKSSGVVSPSSVAWTHLKGVTWAKNFQKHFDVLPEKMAPKFRAQVLTTLAQLGTKFSLVDGKLRKNDDNLLLVSGFAPKTGEVVDGRPRLRHHTAMLWFLSDMVSLARGGWFGYVNPKPLIPAMNIQKLTDGMAKTTMKAFPAADVVSSSTRDAGALLAALGWYGTHAGNSQLASMAADYANALADGIADATDGNGRVGNGAANQAATQGIVTQGLLWASEVDGVDRTDLAADAVGYMVDELWDGDAGTFASGTDDSTYAITARDAGDITGGINAAEAVLGRSDVRDLYATFFDQTFNRGRLQRAQRPPSNGGSAHEPPLPPKAGGEFGQAAVYNAEVAYDTGAGEWSVTDDTFRTGPALYLANQDIWISNWAGDFYQGRGVPGTSDEPPN